MPSCTMRLRSSERSRKAVKANRIGIASRIRVAAEKTAGQWKTNRVRHFRAAAEGNYKISQLPDEGGELQYRVKSAREPHERVVNESELTKA